MRLYTLHMELTCIDSRRRLLRAAPPTDDRWLEVDIDGPRNVFACACLVEERVERVVASAHCLVRRHLSVRLYAVLQAVRFPACIAGLHARLNDVYVDAFAQKSSRRVGEYPRHTPALRTENIYLYMLYKENTVCLLTLATCTCAHAQTHPPGRVEKSPIRLFESPTSSLSIITNETGPTHLY